MKVLWKCPHRCGGKITNIGVSQKEINDVGIPTKMVGIAGSGHDAYYLREEYRWITDAFGIKTKWFCLTKQE